MTPRSPWPGARSRARSFLRFARLPAVMPAVVLAAGFACAAPGANTVSRRPAEHFAAPTSLHTLALSPDGRQLAGLMRREGRGLLFTRAVDGDQATVLIATDNKEFHLRSVRWVNDKRLVVSVGFTSRRHFVGTVESRLLAINADGTSLVNLVRGIPGPGSLSPGVLPEAQDKVMDWMPEDGRHILIALPEAYQLETSVQKIDVDTSLRQTVQHPMRDVSRWLTDRQHRVRIAWKRRPEGPAEALLRGPEGGAWRPLWKDVPAKDIPGIVGFGTDPQDLLVTAPHEGGRALFAIRLDHPDLPRRLLLIEPRFSWQGQLLSAVPGVVPSPTPGVPAADWSARFKAVDLALPDAHNAVTDVARDERRFIVMSTGKGRPTTYHLAEPDLSPPTRLGSAHDELDGVALRGREVLRVVARDDIALRSHVTLPAGRRLNDGGPPLAAVVLRDGWGSFGDTPFHPLTEFIADRGYAVLHPGRPEEGAVKAGTTRADDTRFTDVTDTLQAAIAQRLVDPTRVCSVGRQAHGGHLALMSAVATPELYRCVVSEGGVTDVPDMVDHQRQYLGQVDWPRQLTGTSGADRARQVAASPARQAARLQAPVLLVHGKDDRAVPIDQSESMAKALRRADKPHRLVALPGNLIVEPLMNLQFYQALEAFLDEHLQPVRPAIE